MLQDQRTAAPFYSRIAAHFEQAQSLDEAERFYIKAGLARRVCISSASPAHLPAYLCFSTAHWGQQVHDQHASVTTCQTHAIRLVVCHCFQCAYT